MTDERRERRLFQASGNYPAIIALAAFAAIAFVAWPIIDRVPPVRANEATAVTCLKNYFHAQRRFAEQNLSSVSGNTSPGLGANAYADNYRNLRYGRDGRGRRLDLIGAAFADVFLEDRALAGAATGEGGAEKARTYQGYRFIKDVSGLPPAEKYGSRFALLAFPERAGITGQSIFRIDETGRVVGYSCFAERLTAGELLREYREGRIPSPPSPPSGAEAEAEAEWWDL